MPNNSSIIFRELLQTDIGPSGAIDYGEFLALNLYLSKIEKVENFIASFLITSPLTSFNKLAKTLVYIIEKN